MLLLALPREVKNNQKNKHNHLTHLNFIVNKVIVICKNCVLSCVILEIVVYYDEGGGVSKERIICDRSGLLASKSKSSETPTALPTLLFRSSSSLLWSSDILSLFSAKARHFRLRSGIKLSCFEPAKIHRKISKKSSKSKKLSYLIFGRTGCMQMKNHPKSLQEFYFHVWNCHQNSSTDVIQDVLQMQYNDHRGRSQNGKHNHTC